MTDCYYSLRWKDGDGQARNLSAQDDTVRIGQREDCELRLANDGLFADELFAVIKPARSASGWQIIPVSPFVSSMVNGTAVGLNHYLKNGDHITFGEGEVDITFEIRKGTFDPSAAYGDGNRHHQRIVVLTMAVAVAALLAIYAIFAPSIKNAIITDALASADESIFKISADSVCLVMTAGGRDTVVNRTAISTPGTAFLSDDGLLVTARHCVEPWIAYPDIDLIASGNHIIPEYVRFALFAETYNWLHNNDTTYRVISKCSLFNSSGALLKMLSSSDFLYDTSRDDILELGDYSRPLFWRSIAAGFGRKDMMMDDIALIRGYGGTGKITLLPQERMQSLLKAGSKLYFRGFPVRQQGVGMEKAEKLIFNDFIPGKMICHDKLEHGYSGSPALVVYKNKVYAAGVLSTLDDRSPSCAYSVPVTEINGIED